MRPVEKLDVYRLARHVAVEVCSACEREPLKSRWSIKDQILRASMSVPANIAEGYALGTRPQMVKFLRVALGSNEELRTHFDVVVQSGILPALDADLAADMPRVTSMLVGLLKRYGARPSP